MKIISLRLTVKRRIEQGKHKFWDREFFGVSFVSFANLGFWIVYFSESSETNLSLYVLYLILNQTIQYDITILYSLGLVRWWTADFEQLPDTVLYEWFSYN